MAGRVREGMCVNLFTRPRAESLDAFGVPEMRRVPLDGLCLSVKALPAFKSDRCGRSRRFRLELRNQAWF